jgi:hypothetical protein
MASKVCYNKSYFIALELDLCPFVSILSAEFIYMAYSTVYVLLNTRYQFKVKVKLAL